MSAKLAATIAQGFEPECRTKERTRVLSYIALAGGNYALGLYLGVAAALKDCVKLLSALAFWYWSKARGEGSV